MKNTHEIQQNKNQKTNEQLHAFLTFIKYKSPFFLRSM